MRYRALAAGSPGRSYLTEGGPGVISESSRFASGQVTLSKILKAKKEKIDTLRNLNEQAEKMRSFGQEVSWDFQKKYASLVLEMEIINKELNHNLVEVQQFCQKVGLAREDVPSRGKDFLIEDFLGNGLLRRFGEGVTPTIFEEQC